MTIFLVFGFFAISVSFIGFYDPFNISVTKYIFGAIFHKLLRCVNEKNVGAFLAVGVKGFGVGGNLVNKAWINEGRWDLITELAAEFVRNVQA